MVKKADDTELTIVDKEIKITLLLNTSINIT